jgi:hypothetical protein
VNLSQVIYYLIAIRLVPKATGVVMMVANPDFAEAHSPSLTSTLTKRSDGLLELSDGKSYERTGMP